MKALELLPDGWPVTLSECPPGPFLFNNYVGFKSEYSNDNGPEAYNEAGEFFWGGVTECEERNKLIVQPLKYEWTEK